MELKKLHFASLVVMMMTCVMVEVPLVSYSFLHVSMQRAAKVKFLSCCRSPLGLNQESEGRMKLRILCRVMACLVNSVGV